MIEVDEKSTLLLYDKGSYEKIVTIFFLNAQHGKIQEVALAIENEGNLVGITPLFKNNQ